MLNIEKSSPLTHEGVKYCEMAVDEFTKSGLLVDYEEEVGCESFS